MALLLTCSSIVAEGDNIDNIPDFDETGNWFPIPFAFSSDSTGLAGGVGIGLRAMVSEMPVRFDVAASEEGVNMWVMIQQPFDF